MSYRGDIRLGDTIDVKFSTVGTTGAPTTLAGTPVISAYVGNSTTQITAGITLTVDFDGVTGLHNVRVVASSGNGFATQTNVDLVITTGTVGGTSVVGYVIGSFSIENRSALMPATAGRTATIDASGQVSVGAMATDVITSTVLAASAVAEIQSGLSTLDAAAVRSAIGLASANLDTQFDALPTAVENADALLGRNVSGGSSTGRTVKQAFHFLRNKWVVATGTLTVYDTDDSTTSWTAAVTGTAGADPVTGTDPS